MQLRALVLLLVVAVIMSAQNITESSATMKQILERLDTLEKENRELVQDVKSLREELAAAHSSAQKVSGDESRPDQASLGERLSVEEKRTAEQAQTKVEAAHKFPIQLDGMLLFNAFGNSAASVEFYPEEGYNLLTGPARDGATVRQTLLGFDFQGPHLPGGGRVNGFLTMDFYGGSSDPQYIRPR